MAVNVPNYSIEKLEKLIELFVNLKNVCKYVSSDSFDFCENTIQTLCSARDALEAYKRIVDSYNTQQIEHRTISSMPKEQNDKIVSIITDILKNRFNVD